LDKPKSSQKIRQGALALALSSAFLLVCFAGLVPSVSAQPVALISASYGTLGSYNVVKANLTNEWSSSLDLLVFAVWKNSGGQTVAVPTGGLTVAPGENGTAFAPLAGSLPTGLYSVSVFVITANDNPVSIALSFYVNIYPSTQP